MPKTEASQIEMKVHPRFRGRRVTPGTAKWKQSFFDYALHLRTYFREYAAELTEDERRKLAVAMGLPVQCNVCPEKEGQK